MLKRFRNTCFLNYFWFAMALYVFNCSVDTPDLNANFTPENLLINDQESIIEMVAEKLLYLEDAIPESDDADGEELSLKKSFSLDVFTVAVVTFEIQKNVSAEKNTTTAYIGHFSAIPKEKHSPPPEV